MMPYIFKAVLLYTLYYVQKVEAVQDECRDQECPSFTSSNDVCSIYLSPSSVPGGGMGIFSMKDFQKGDIILQADGPNIPIIDPYRTSRKQWALFESYWWGEHSGLSPEMRFESRNIADYQITFGYEILFNAVIEYRS